MKIKLQSKKSLLEQEDFEVKIVYNQAENFYTINAYNTKGEVVCRATFKTSYSPRQIWLYKIATAENYQHKGYATAVIKAMEYFAFKSRFDQIEGKYYPENEHAKSFYDKHKPFKAKRKFYVFIKGAIYNKNSQFSFIFVIYNRGFYIRYCQIIC